VADDLRKEIKAINYETVVYLRTTTDKTGWVQALNDAAVKIFQLLAPKWKDHATYDTLWKALDDAADDAVRCVDWAYEKSNRGGFDWPFHSYYIKRRLDGRADGILNQWWTREADSGPGDQPDPVQRSIRPTPPPTRPATRTRAPQTATRSRIEAYLNRVEAETGVKVNKKDFWLRPTKLDGTSRYNSDREFRHFQKEDASQPNGAKAHFLRVLTMDPQIFIDGLEDRRQAHKVRKIGPTVH
jgi:hypothetical protein